MMTQEVANESCTFGIKMIPEFFGPQQTIETFVSNGTAKTKATSWLIIQVLRNPNKFKCILFIKVVMAR
jgi:hypothetical protein